MTAILGKINNKNVPLDVQCLLETKMLIQANSGGGKSYAIRRFLEQTHGMVQQIVIDSEGEFSTLREKYDYIIAAPVEGDAIANPQTAALLARKLMEFRVSAIIDIYELKPYERKEFVDNFLRAMVNLPKKLWSHVIIILDEAHNFAPQSSKSESKGAVIDCAALGRKRGQCLIPATQRISKLHKDVVAECNNILIGRTTLDLDIKRAADDLGMSRIEARRLLRNLKPGEFYSYGPALVTGINKIKIGPVKSYHPRPGQKLLDAPPPPSTKVKNILAKLSDLPTESRKEIETLSALKTENAQLKRELALAKKPAGNGASPTEGEIQRRINEAVAAATSKGGGVNNQLMRELQNAMNTIGRIAHKYNGVVEVKNTQNIVIHKGPISPGSIEAVSSTKKYDIKAGAVRILKELAARYPAGYSKSQVAVLTQFSIKSGTFANYLSNLKKSSYISESAGLLYATETGIKYLGADIPKAPTSHEEAMALWRNALKPGAYKILSTIVMEGNKGISKEGISYVVGMTQSSGTFANYLSVLRRNGLITESHGVFVASKILYPETD